MPRSSRLPASCDELGEPEEACGTHLLFGGNEPLSGRGSDESDDVEYGDVPVGESLQDLLSPAVEPLEGENPLRPGDDPFHLGPHGVELLVGAGVLGEIPVHLWRFGGVGPVDPAVCRPRAALAPLPASQ